MVKCITILAVAAASLAAAGSASAGCPGASAGHRGGATVPAQRVVGHDAEGLPIIDEGDVVTVTLDARWIDVCDDGSVITGATIILGAPTALTIEGEDDSCSAETLSDWDPFGFAVGVHDLTTTPTCAIDMSWSGFTGVYAPDAARSGPTDGGVRVTLSKATNHENGKVFINGKEYRAHGEAVGAMWTGVGADA